MCRKSSMDIGYLKEIQTKIVEYNAITVPYVMMIFITLGRSSQRSTALTAELEWTVITMREILFRGKRTDNGEWVEGYYVCKSKDSHTSQHFIIQNFRSGSNLDSLVEFEVIPETVCHYTNFNDENGKIYEGDIINVLQDRLMEVRWDFEELTWKLFDVGIPVGEINLYYNTIDLAALYLEKCYENQMISEVVGNIYDNPELLKADKEKLKQITSRWYYG